MGARVLGLRQVSIHAPVKGATGRVRQAHDRELVSIHAPVKGATTLTSPARCRRRRFNPRAREGRDPASPLFLRLPRVSIHAPVKGATGRDGACPAQLSVSIHAPVKGATVRALRGCVPDIVSIHAPVKGATSIATNAKCASTCFNPRAREGRDPDRDARPAGLVVSIHAPVKGATGRRPDSRPSSSGFNPRAREGRDCQIVQHMTLQCKLLCNYLGTNRLFYFNLISNLS